MNERICAICGKKVYPRRLIYSNRMKDYSNKFINVSAGIDLVFCSKKHKDKYIHNRIKKLKSILFF